jgi:hypothetical protein
MANEPVNISSPAGNIAACQGAFLALPKTFVVAVVLGAYPEACWPAKVPGVRFPPKGEPSS